MTVQTVSLFHITVGHVNYVLQWRSRHCVFYREVTVNTLQQFLKERRGKFGTLQRLARTMGITFSGFLRGVKQGTLSTDNCLLLAEVLGEQPSNVFRAAKKPDLADRFERLYGKTSNSMTAEERDVLAVWNAMPRPVRENMLSWMRNFIPSSTADQIAPVQGSYSRGVKLAEKEHIDVGQPAHPVVIGNRRHGSTKNRLVDEAPIESLRKKARSG